MLILFAMAKIGNYKSNDERHTSEATVLNVEKKNVERRTSNDERAVEGKGNPNFQASSAPDVSLNPKEHKRKKKEPK